MSHKTAVLPVREHILQHVERLLSRLAALKRLEILDEYCLLHTCNRIEVYGVSSLTPDVERLLARFCIDTAGPSPEEVKDSSYVLEGRDAVRHLMEVATGLDSLILGERQILGQTKEAYKRGQQRDSVGTLLGRLFSASLRWARIARQKSALDRFAVDMAYSAVDLARRIFGSLDGLPVAIVGSGKMGRLALDYLDRAGAGRKLVVNRTLERAEDLAKRFGGEAATLEGLFEALAKADVIISSTGSRETLMDTQMMRAVMEERRGRPILLLDLAIPRDVEDEVSALANVYLYNIDELEDYVDSNLEKREAAAATARSIIEEGLLEFEQWRRARRVAPLLAAMDSKLEAVVEKEYLRLYNKIDCSPAEEGRIKEALKRVAKKVLHPCLSRLRNYGGRDDEEGRMLLKTAAKLFDLEDSTSIGSPEKGENDPK